MKGEHQKLSKTAWKYNIYFEVVYFSNAVDSLLCESNFGFLF